MLSTPTDLEQMNKLKNNFIEQLKKEQCFCSCSLFFNNGMDAINFWNYCGLHYPYTLKCHPTGYELVLDGRYATSILLELTTAMKISTGRQMPDNDAQQFDEMKLKFIGELRARRFSQKGFFHVFKNIETAIKFWAHCNLSFPYSFLQVGSSFYIEFEEKFGCSILETLENDLTNQVPKAKSLEDLEKQLLDELQAFDWKNAGKQPFEFSHKFNVKDDATSFADFCNIEQDVIIDVSQKPNMEMVTIGCYQSQAFTIVKKLLGIPITPADYSRNQFHNLGRLLLYELQAFTVPNNIFFEFSHAFNLEVDAINFSHFCNIRWKVIIDPKETKTKIYCSQGNIDLIKKELMALDGQSK